jgi:hypothetical protein
MSSKLGPGVLGSGLYRLILSLYAHEPSLASWGGVGGKPINPDSLGEKFTDSVGWNHWQ